MDTKGISLALKLLVFIAVLTVLFVIMNATGFYKPRSQQPGQPTPTISATATPTVSVISSTADVDALSKELDASLSEVDAFDKDFAALDTSFSTTDIDVLVKDLNAIN